MKMRSKGDETHYADEYDKIKTKSKKKDKKSCK